MTVDTLLDRAPAWLAESGPGSGIALLCQCALVRNLADFPFPVRCSEEEKQAVEERILATLDSLGLLSHGQYYSLPSLSMKEARFLAERRLITYDLFAARGPRGVYVSDNQAMSIMVNGSDHLCLRVLLSGMQLQEAWAQVNLMDDTLRGLLDFAFDERLGFLASDLGTVGTGLKASVVMHLPALQQSNRTSEYAEQAAQERLSLRGVRIGPGTGARAVATPEYLLNQALFTDVEGAIGGAVQEAAGALFLLVNQSTLGISEEETLFQVRHAASDLTAAEETARAALLQEAPRGLEDLVGRARGAASGAHLLDFGEALELLSALRLGVDAQLLPQISPIQLNELMIGSQGAHLALAGGREEDPLTLSMNRADLFRSVFGN
jgi:protein arginine kinase